MFAMSFQLEKGLTEYCHLVMVPVFPARVSNPLVLPEQMVVPPLTLPPALSGFTVTTAKDELADAHAPLCTTALYWVVVVRLV